MKITDMAVGIAHDGRTKTDRYGWGILGEEPKHMVLNLSDLNVGSYQRGEASRASTIEKAKNHDPAAVGACVVGMRSDGTFWVVDGLQRALSRALRGDLKTIDCMVFNSKGPEHEAKVFQRCNMGRATVRAIHKYKVGVEAGDSPHVEIEKWLIEHGLRVSFAGKKNSLSFPAILVVAWKSDKSAAMRAVLFNKSLSDGMLHGEIFKCAFYLISNGINIEEYEQKIIKMGGHAKLLHDINAKAIEAGLGKTPRICAMGILSCINHRKRFPVIISERR